MCCSLPSHRYIFWYNTLQSFLGGMLGSALVQQVRGGRAQALPLTVYAWLNNMGKHRMRPHTFASLHGGEVLVNEPDAGLHPHYDVLPLSHAQ